MALVGNTVEQKIWNYLKTKGLNDYGVAGMMGNLYAESGLKSTNLQQTYEKSLNYSDDTYTKAVDNGTYVDFGTDRAGYGLAQWTYPTRKAKLLQFAKSQGKSIGDLEMQLDFLWKELTGGYKNVLNVLKVATSVLEASNIVLLEFEAPADKSVGVQNKRAGFGQKYYDKYASATNTTDNKYVKGTSVRLSQNFTSTEFDCHGKGCCSETIIDKKLIEYLQQIRNHFGASITINSGYRCEKHNASVGGASKSKHKSGQAADIVVKGVAPLKVAQYAESIGILGIGQYPSFVHVDTRTTKSYWYGSNEEPRSTFGKYVDDSKVNDNDTSNPNMGGNGKMKYNANNKPLVCMQTNSTCYKGTSKMTVKGVLWHSTGANNPWLKRYVQPSDNAADRAKMLELIGKNAYGNDWNHISRQAGLNCWVGKLADGTVATVQTMPWDYKPWGCGSGSKGSCNNGWIQFEICEDALTDKTYFNAVYKEACEITAYLCNMYNLDPNGTVTLNGVKVPVILCHADSYKLGLGSNHGDVLHWFKKHGKTMDDVRRDVAALMEKEATTSPTTPVEPEVPVSEMYRVRKSWTDAKSQVGAYRELQNAKDACDKAGNGYYVFNSAGTVVYPVVDKLEVGDKVFLVSGAKYTSGATPKPWVYTSTLYVRELRSNDTIAVISTQKTGDITGVVYVKDLKKIGSGTVSAPVTPTFQAYKVKVTASLLNIRKGAGTNYAICGSIKNKGVYTIVDEATGKGATKWGKLKSGAGWISLDYCVKV